MKQIFLCCNRNTANFCFWDAFATSFDEEYKKQNQKPVIVIVSSCRYNIFKSKIPKLNTQLLSEI